MASNRKLIRVSGRVIRSLLIVAVLQRGSFTINSGAALSAGFPVAHAVVKAPSAPKSSIATARRPGLDSALQASSQTRPRRVKPSDPEAKSSPDNADESTAKSKSPVDPRSDPNPKSPATSNRESGAAPSYTVQVGAFLQPENARRLAQTLGKSGFTARVLIRSDSRGKKWHCVRVGSYPDQEQAHKVATDIEGKLKLKPIIRPSASL
jgi:cell division protein FtsN